MATQSLRLIVSTLVVVVLASPSSRVAADDKTAAIGGKWKGKYIETNGNFGEFPLELSEDAGKVTGTWNNEVKVENGLRVADTLVWRMQAGDSPYVVYGKIQDGGKRLTLDYTFVETIDGRLQKVTGTATLQKE